jgi:hypothetical protein
VLGINRLVKRKGGEIVRSVGSLEGAAAARSARGAAIR